jgi:hypothetical protein
MVRRLRFIGVGVGIGIDSRDAIVSGLLSVTAVRSIPIPTPTHTTSMPVPANETPHTNPGRTILKRQGGTPTMIMIKKRFPAIPPLGLWVLVGLLGLYLGWSFNSAYFSMLGDMNRSVVRFLSLSSLDYGENIVPSSERVFQVFIVVQILVAAVCLLLSFWSAVTVIRKRIQILLSAVFLPVMFYCVALFCRMLTGKGIITASSLDEMAMPGLAAGESFMIWPYQFSRGIFGMAVKNIQDTRSVMAMLVDYSESLWVNHPAFTVVAAALCAGVLAGMTWIGYASRPIASPPAS